MTGSSIGAYVAQVDRVLGAGQALYDAPNAPAETFSATALLAPPPRDSGLAVGVGDAADRYRWQSHVNTALDAHTDTAATDGSTQRRQGAAGLTTVRDTARSQAAAITPTTGSPAGVKLLVSRMDERLTAMQRQLDSTKAQNRLLATRLRQLATAYRITSPTGASGGSLSRMGPAAAMPGLGSLAGAPTSAIPGLTAERGQPQDPELTGAFARDEPAEPAARAVEFAKTKLGLPYVWGAQGPRAYDCSGLVRDAYRHAGIALPRTTYDMIAVGTPVARSEIRPGDLVLSNFSAPGRPEHVQLAVSPTTVIEAPTPGGHVQYSNVPSGHIVVKRIT